MTCGTVSHSRLIFIFFFMLCGILHAGDTDTKNLARENKNLEHPKSSGPYPIFLYRKYISPVIGDRCPMYPSCSHYSTEAFKKHGPIMGIIMTCDRLMRCGRDETKLSPAVVVDGERYYFDPVENNDFRKSR